MEGMRMSRETQLKAGGAKRDITPSVGKLIACFPDKPNRRGRVAEGVQYPIMAKALCLEAGGTGVILCGLDAMGLQWADVRAIREQVSGAVGLPSERVLLFGTHTHHGPECSYLFGGSPDDPYIAEMKARICEAAVEAWNSRMTARIGAATTRLEENYNRRKILGPGQMQQWSTNPERMPNEPVDPTLAVLRIDCDASPSRFVLFNWTAHALVMSGESKLFTADFPGAAEKRIEERLGESALAIFANGCAGNVHPYVALTNSVADMERLGEQLASQTVPAYESVEWADPCDLRVQSDILRFPHRLVEGDEAEAEIAAFCIGPDIAFVFIPGDPFVEIQIGIREASPFRHTFVVGYSSGWVGYVPMAKDFESGGYGVDEYPHDPPCYSRTSLPPGAGDRIRDRAIELVQALS